MPDDHYTPPTGAEARALLRALGLTGAAAGNLVGVDSRTVRRWTGGERPMPFASLYTILSRQAQLTVTPEHWRDEATKYLRLTTANKAASKAQPRSQESP